MSRGRLAGSRNRPDSPRSQAYAERFRRYCELRDAGTRTFDAGREVGLTDGTSARYELAYREARGLSRRSRDWSR